MATPRYTLTSLFICLAFTGCATQPKAENAQVQIDRQILDASQKIQSAQAELYQAGALNQATTKLPLSIVDDQHRVTLSWQGDALQLLNKLAHDRGLTFSFIGLRMPLPVNIDVKDVSYDDVIQLIRTQIGYRANITQYTHKMVLQYNQPQS
ncbi:DotD/TraH family lipoprotein [Xylella fastidiosa]|uniref:DotD/TraH family lipoprotein n=2 Tax=Xylella fastidiosa TaxID=2371 RepID=UPI000FEC8851|nr:DotD/TraH family lipoprotein [Xylella fastidiosa]MRU28330.1 conjugal transfer protein TraH [Xylella fastidiosa subsp. multiplex]MRU30720.1 conjugal transfer protein TraH [Xylella fastidiosa subsp. multiplex]UIT53450.1 DotD/TraH family lipoprotein [Xylella fastidiosa subsp. fastidiosa]WLE28548.1 DotD/TraH family lipoprotein [Xylella fastidiosa subsp. multiplex]